MDDRPGSPEIDVVSDGDRSEIFRSQSERLLSSSRRNATSLLAANQNGANRAAANTNTPISKVETVNLRVRNMGKIVVKKEPESDEDCEVSYSLSSLLQECDFEKAPTKKPRALKSPTSLAIARSKTMEATRPAIGRPRQSLENVISSLKSARATGTKEPKTTKRASNIQNPVVPISMPSQIASTAPTPQRTISMPISVATGAGPQIIDVRSLATGAQTVLGGATKRITRSAASKPAGLGSTPNTRVVANLPVSITKSVSHAKASTTKTISSSGAKPLNIRFVLPATEPFNTSEFQQALQAALASVISQSKGIEASLLQQAIQAALTTVTQSSVPLNANQLQQAIQSSLAALSGTAPIPQVTQTSLTQVLGARQPQTTQGQLQAIMPMPSPIPLLPAASATKESSKAIVNGGNLLTSSVNTSSPVPPNQSPLNLARDALIKALQEKRVLNSPTSVPSSASSSSSSMSEVSPSVTVADSFDEPCSGSPPSSPVLPPPETPALNSAGVEKSLTPTSVSSNTTFAAKTVPPTARNYLKPNQSPMNSGTQTTLKSVPLQLQSSQGSSASLPTVTSSLTPGNVTVNLIGQANPPVQPAVASLPASKVPPPIAPAQLVQFSLFPANSKNVSVNKPDNKHKPDNKLGVSAAQTQTTAIFGCGGGCCQYCRACHENNNRCGLPSCQKTYPTRAGLRKHYYFNPTHKPSLPLEKASTACDNFLPLELNDAHRRARLRELFRRLPDEEFREHVKPRMAKVVSLFQLLEQKSLRVHLGTISGFKMFTEFERFKKEVEAKLLELILLPDSKPQGKVSAGASEVSSKDGRKPADMKNSETTVEAAKQSSKDSTPSGTANTDKILECSGMQPKPDSKSVAGNSETAKKTVDTICIDADVEMSTVKATDAGAGLQSGSVEALSADKPASNEDGKGDVCSAGATDSGTLTVEDKKTGDTSSVEGKAAEPGKDSGDVTQSSTPTSATVPLGESLASKDGEKKEDEPPKQSSSLPESLEGDENAASHSKPNADQPPEHEQTDLPGLVPGVSTPKDTASVPMEVDEQSTKHASAAGSKPSESQSSDVIMVDSQKEGESCSKGEELKSTEEEQMKESQNLGAEKADVEKEATVCSIEGDKPVICTGEESQGATASSEEKTSKEQNEKLPYLVSKESKTAAGENSETGQKDDKSADTTQEDKMAEKPADGEKAIVVMDVEEQGNKSKNDSEESQVKDAAEEKTQKAEAKAEEPRPSNDQDGTVKVDGKDAKSGMDPENQIKEDQQKQVVKNDADGEQKGGSIEIIDVDSGDDGVTASSSKQTPEVAMEIDKVEVDRSKGDKNDASKEKTSHSLEEEGSQVIEVPKSSDKGSEPNAESVKLKDEQSAKASSSEASSLSSDTTGSSDAPSAGGSNSMMQAENNTAVVKKKRITLEDLDLGDDEDEDEIDENNLLDFTIPFAVKWGKIVKKVTTLEAKKIARKENYSDQDMKHFIYNKPKDAANAVILADCHAHPSFFRAYVMPALLDVYIDDFGLFGKKLLSRLYLPKEKYVRVLRNGIGPELAKILGINIFPTFKRIQDTWQSIKMPLGNALSANAKSKSKTVLSIDPEDDVEVPEDENEAAPVDKTAGSSQNAAGKATDSLKRPGPADTMQNDNNKKQRLDNSVAQKDSNQTKEGSKEQPNSSEKAAQKDGSQPNDPNKGLKPDEADSSKKATDDDKRLSDESNKKQSGISDSTQVSDKTPIPVIDLESLGSKTGATSSTSVPEKESTSQPAEDRPDGPDTDGAEPMSVDQEEDPKSSNASSKEGPTVSSVAVEMSTGSTSSAQTSPKASCSADKPSTSTGDATAKTCISSIIPAKATIYTSGVGKKGASGVPLPATKGSPLFLIPVEKISPKLVEQFIQQGKGDGVKTRSSDKKKAKKTKETSQVLVLIPSSNPNGSPTIQTLTSTEQLESTGDKKPLLLLPPDKVPKSIASQSQTVRRKMVITMVAPSSGATSGTKSTVSSVQSASATSASTTGGQSAEPTSAVQSVKGPIMSTQEGKTTTTSTDGNSDSSITPATGSDSRESVDDSAKSLALVVNNTSALSGKDSSGAGTQPGSGTGPTGADKANLQSAAGSSESDTASDSLNESSTDKESASNKVSNASENSGSASSEAPPSAAVSGATDVDENQSSASNTGLDLLGSSVLPSDLTLDSLLQDIEGDGSGAEGNEMPPLDVSEIIKSFEDIPVESGSSTPANSSLFDSEGDTGTVGDSSESANEIQMASSIQDKSSLQDEHDYAISRRQSPRRTPAQGGSKGDSDGEEGSPPRKRRKAPTRSSARSAPQVTFVPDKEITAKGSQSSPAKAKGRKQ